MTQVLIQECLLKGGGIESRGFERSRMASFEELAAGGEGAQEPPFVRQPNDHQRDFVAHPYRSAVARSAGEVRQVDDGLSALPTMERGRYLGSCRNDAFP